MENIEISDGFEISVAHNYEDIWHQGYTPYCCSYVGAHLMTVIYRQLGHKTLVISPQELVTYGCFTTEQVEKCLVKGVYGLNDQQFLRMRNMTPKKISGERYKIGGFITYDDSKTFTKALVDNFSRKANVIYPVFGCLHMFGFSSDLAKLATKTQPFFREVQAVYEELRTKHAVLITGIHVLSVDPLEISVEIKNSHGEEWGNKGRCWVKPSFFYRICVPYMGSCDTTKKRKKKKDTGTLEEILQAANKNCKVQQEKEWAKGLGGGRNARKPSRNAVAKKTSVVIELIETSTNSSMDTGNVNVPATVKPRGQKKAPAKNKGKASVTDEDDEEIPLLVDRMARQNLHSKQDDDDIVETPHDQSEEAPKKKVPTKRAAAKKKATITKISDDEEEVKIDMSDDSDFEATAAPLVEKKKGGRKLAAAKPPVAATKKQGAAAGGPFKAIKQTCGGQKRINERLKPVRKMRPSPFNKKSVSVLGRMSKKDDEMVVGELRGEVAVAVWPQRANRKKMTYVITESAEDVDDEVSDDSL